MSDAPRVCQVLGCHTRSGLAPVTVGGQPIATACVVHRDEIDGWLAAHVLATHVLPAVETWRLVASVDKAPVLVPPGAEAPE